MQQMKMKEAMMAQNGEIRMSWKDILKNEEKLSFIEISDTKEYKDTVGQYDIIMDGWKVVQYGVAENDLIDLTAKVLERELPDYDYDEDYKNKKVLILKEWLPILSKIVEAIKIEIKTGRMEIIKPTGDRDMNPEESRQVDFGMGREM